MKNAKLKNVINRFKTDISFRTVVSSVVSIITTVIFVAYNMFLWQAYQASWNISIAIYFFLLIVMRAFIMIAERRVNLSAKTTEQKDKIKVNLFLTQSILLFVIDLSLITPISLMVIQQKAINYTVIPAIATAVYTVYKITTASIGFKKTRKIQNLSVRMLKNISFMDAFVSGLTLQYTLIMTFGNGIVGEMFVLCCITTTAIWVLLVVLSVLSVIRATKIRKISATEPTDNN